MIDYGVSVSFMSCFVVKLISCYQLSISLWVTVFFQLETAGCAEYWKLFLPSPGILLYTRLLYCNPSRPIVVQHSHYWMPPTPPGAVIGFDVLF